jgi:hypothetical protein
MERALQVMARVFAPRIAIGRFLLGRVGDKGNAQENARDSVTTQRLATTFTLIAVAFLGGDVRYFDLRLTTQPDDAVVDTVDEFFDHAGLRGFTDDVVPGHGSIIPEGHLSHRDDVLSTLENMQVGVLRTTVMGASLEELEWSRDSALSLVAFVHNFARNVQRLGGPRNAFGMAAGLYLKVNDELVAFFTAMVLVLGQMLGRDHIDDSIAQLRPAFLLQEHLSLLLDFLPRRFRRFVGVDGENRLAAADTRARREYIKVLDRFDAMHPGILFLDTVKELAR